MKKIALWITSTLALLSVIFFLNSNTKSAFEDSGYQGDDLFTSAVFNAGSTITADTATNNVIKIGGTNKQIEGSSSVLIQLQYTKTSGTVTNRIVLQGTNFPNETNWIPLDTIYPTASTTYFYRNNGTNPTVAVQTTVPFAMYRFTFSRISNSGAWASTSQAATKVVSKP